jgi:hypothetical protein
MIFGFDLKEIFFFPFKDEAARKNLLLATLIFLIGMIIPVLPVILITGYAVQVSKRVLNGESLQMPAWEDWSSLFKDGLKLFAIRMIYSLPLLIIAVPLMLSLIGLPIFLETAEGQNQDALFAIFMVVIMGGLCILIPLSLPLAVIIPAAEMHAIEQDNFSAAFHFKNWWQVLRANLGGFIVAFAIYYLATFAMTFVIQILMATVVLACLLIVLLPGVSVYAMLIMYATIAIAYRDGRTKLNTTQAV